MTKKQIEGILRKYQPPLSNENIEAITAQILEVTEPIEKERMITATRE